MSDLPSTSQGQGSTGSSDDSADPSQRWHMFIDARQFIDNTYNNLPQEGSSPKKQRLDTEPATCVEPAENQPPSTNVESRWKEFIAISKKEASTLCGQNDSILEDRKVNIAPLELSTQPRDSKLIDESGHYHHRKEIAQIYNKSSTQIIIQDSELFDKAMDHAKKESKKCDTQEAKKNFQLENGNVVGVVGQAGIGKSTLTKFLVQKFLSQDLDYEEIILFLRFRDLNYINNMNLLQFLTHNSAFANRLKREELNQLLDKLSQSDKVCILIDGFDESSIEGASKPLTGSTPIYDTVKAEIFIKYLISGKLLPKAKKLFTSRPRQLYDMHKSYRPRFVVNVLGLNGEAQKQICQDVCKNNDACAQVLKFVNDRPDLKSFCYVPVNCILIMYCLNENFLSSDLAASERVDSITTILIATLYRFIKNGHLREEFRIANLSCLAYKTFVANRIIFEEKDLKNANISENQASTFLTTRLGKKANLRLLGGIIRKIYFSHLLLHEFFVAVYFILFMDVAEFGKSLSYLTENKYEMVARFVFGLCNSVTNGYLQELVASEEIDLSHTEEKKKMLEELALKQAASARWFADSLQVFSWIYEIRDDAITKTAVSNLKSELEVDGGILPSDIPAFQYMLQWRNSPLTLTVCRPKFEGGCFEKFCAALHAILQSGNVKIKELDFCGNALGDDGAVHLAQCLRNVEELFLIECNIGVRGVDALSQEIKQRDHAIKRLDLRRNKFGDDGAVHLATCLHNVKTLKLWECNIGIRGIEALSQGVHRRDHGMETLELDGNEFGDEGVEYLKICLHNIKNLSMLGCNISDDVGRSLQNNSAGCSVKIS